MKLLFISGPYRAATTWDISMNIVAARRAAIKMWQAGYAVICPHSNTSHFDGICPDETWLDGDLEMLRRCDVIYMMAKWQESEGARVEHDLAIELGIVVIYETRNR